MSEFANDEETSKQLQEQSSDALANEILRDLQVKPKKKNYKVFWIIATLVILVLSSAFVWLKNTDLSIPMSHLVESQINRNINGSVKFTGFQFTLYKERSPRLHFDELIIYDVKHDLILDANNIELVISTRNLLRSLIFFKSIKADNLTLNAVREQDFQWNFDKLAKDKKKRFNFKFGEIDLNDIDLSISDIPNNSKIAHENIRLNFKPKNRGYSLDLETVGLADKLHNYVKIAGDIRANSLDQFLDKRSNIDLEFNNIDGATLGLITGLTVTNSESIIRKLFDKYGSKSSLSLKAKLRSAKTKADDKQLNVQATLNDIADIGELTFNTDIEINKDLKFKKADLSFDGAILDLRGSISNWRKDNAGLGLDLHFTDLNLFELVDRFPELERYIPGFLLEIFNVLHGSDYIDGTFNLSSSIKEPQLIAKVKLSQSSVDTSKLRPQRAFPTIINAEQDILAKLTYSKNQIIIQEFKLPIDYSVLSVTGNYQLLDHSFKINLITKDLPLAKLRPIAASIPFFKDYREIIAQSFLSGYVSFDLNIAHNSKQGTLVKGPIKIAKLNYKSPNYPLTFKNIIADLNIDKDQITINHFQGYAYNPIYGEEKARNYIEARGSFNLAKLGSCDLEIAAPKIDAQTLVDSGIIELINDKSTIKVASGELKNIFITLKSSPNTTRYTIDGKLDVNSVDLTVKQGLNISKMKGSLGLSNNRLKFDGLNFILNKNSLISLDGSINQDLTQPGFKLKANQLNFIEFINLFDPSHEKLKINPLAGNLDADIEFRTKELYGNLRFYNLGLEYSGSKYTKYPITKLNGALLLGKDISLTNASGKFGKSSFNNFNCKIENYQSKDLDRTINIGMNGDLLYGELKEFIPSGISSLIDIQGFVPAKVTISGNKLKKAFSVILDLNKLESFHFSNWLEQKKNNADISLISNFIVTPQLILSNDTKIVFTSKAGVTPPVTSKLKSIFQVEDWSKGDTMTYYVSIKTPVDELAQDLSIVAPHILSLQPLNLRTGSGIFTCDTFGNLKDRQTICEFKVNRAVAQKYGIGDLTADLINVDLLSIVDKPLEVQVKLGSGDWNGIPYKNIKFDLSAEGNYVYIKDLKAHVKQGMVRGETSFNIQTLESSFKLKGQNLPAHEMAQGIWALGSEVPEGLVDGTFEGTTKGILPDPMFFNLVGTGNMIVRDGKLSQMVLMQKILTAVNTLDNFDLNNIFQTLVTLKGGLFNYIISSLKYDHGKVSSEKLLLKAPQIELNLSGYLDYAKDQQWIKGRGLIPKKSVSILSSVGVGKVNLGNLVSMSDLSEGGSKEKRFFDFVMIGPISDPKKSAESLKSNFSWE